MHTCYLSGLEVYSLKKKLPTQLLKSVNLLLDQREVWRKKSRMTTNIYAYLKWRYSVTAENSNTEIRLQIRHNSHHVAPRKTAVATPCVKVLFIISIKDTFTARLCRGDTLDHAPESCLFVLVFPTLVHLPPGHSNSLKIV